MAKPKQPAQNSEQSRQKRLANLKGHKFKPGQSGNPGGRPKKKPLTDAYREALAELVPGDAKGRTFAQLIAQQLVKKAAVDKHYLTAAEIADRVEGKADRSIDLNVKRSIKDFTDEEIDALLAESEGEV
jgi:hypothetical protein